MKRLVSELVSVDEKNKLGKFRVHMEDLVCVHFAHHRRYLIRTIVSRLDLFIKLNEEFRLVQHSPGSTWFYLEMRMKNERGVRLMMRHLRAAGFAPALREKSTQP